MLPSRRTFFHFSARASVLEAAAPKDTTQSSERVKGGTREGEERGRRTGKGHLDPKWPHATTVRLRCYIKYDYHSFAITAILD